VTDLRLLDTGHRSLIRSRTGVTCRRNNNIDSERATPRTR
jgi:hypothetical protein